jgi:hypothetical protein
MRLRPHKEIMRRLLFACCLLFAALVPCMARAVLLDGLRFAPADAGRCAGLANPAQRPMTLAALAP